MTEKQARVAAVHIDLKVEFFTYSMIFIRIYGHLNSSFLNPLFWEGTENLNSVFISRIILT